jgi:hypothetical protein
MGMPTARTNSEWLPKAKEALEAAKNNLGAARLSLEAGYLQQSASSLVVAGED